MNKRIAIFLPSLRGGGAERVMATLAKSFSERGYQTDLILAKAEGVYLNDIPASVRIIDFNKSRVALSLWPLIKYLKQEKPDAILSTPNHANILTIVAKFLSRTKSRVVIREANTLSVTNNNLNPKLRLSDRIIPFLVKLTYSYANGIVAVSQGVADDLITTTGLPKHKVTVIYNPVVDEKLYEKSEESIEHPWFAEGEPPVILGVGRLNKQKDFQTLIDAFALVRKQMPVRLIILGEGEERDKLEAQIKAYNLSSDIQLPGFVSNPFPYMKKARLFVLSSLYEGLPNVLIQCLALGTPVIATDCPSGPREILDNGRYGVLIPVQNPNQLAECIFKELTSSDKLISVIDDRVNCFRVEEITNKYLASLSLSKLSLSN